MTFLMAFALRGDDRVTLHGEVLGRITAAAFDHDPVTVADLAPPGAPPAWHFGVIVAVSVAGALPGRRWHRSSVACSERSSCCWRVSVRPPSPEPSASCSPVCLDRCCSPVEWRLPPPWASRPSMRSCSVMLPMPTTAGRSPALESRFQIAWVLGALVPVVVPMPTQLGGLMVCVLGTAAAAFYAATMQAVAKGRRPPRLPKVTEVGGTIHRRVRARRRSGDGGPGGPTASL
ncbi:MAG: hypothetical protein M5U19_08510 [Microthrixaceae bacterium]|nr:hypothetical protein [Microthrixaceae bacterium]